MTFKSLYFLLFFGAQSAGLSAQVHYDPYHAVALPPHAPAWMKAIADNPSGVNFAEMDSLYNDWLEHDWDAKIKTHDKKAAVNFFRRWRRDYAPYVQADGTIRLPLLSDYFARMDAHNSKVSRNTGIMRAPITADKTIPTASWHPIGPMRTRSTQSVKDSQACIYRIDASKTNPNVAYIGAETGVVFKTTDKGKHWKACNGAFDFGKHITAIAVDPANPDVVYVGSDVALWKTVDGGQHWKRIGRSEISTRVNSIKISREDTRYVTVATERSTTADASPLEGGLYVSHDGGDRFDRVFSGKCYDHELKPGDPHTIYLLARQTNAPHTLLHISHDDGQHWETSDMVDGYQWNAGRLAVSDAPGGQDYVYALATEDNGWDNGRGTGKAHIMQSRDGAKTWTDKTVRAQGNSWGGQSTFFDLDERDGGQGYFDMMIGVSSHNPEHVIFGLCSLYRSTTGGGGGWGRFYGGNGIGGYTAVERMHPDMQDICVNGDDTWITNDGGVQYSKDFFASPGESRNTGIYASDYHGFDMGWNEDVMTGGRWHNGDAVQAGSYGAGNTIHVGGVESATGYVFLNDPYQVYFSDAATFKMPKDWNGDVQAIYGKYFAQFTPYEILRSNGRIVFDPRYAERFIVVGNESNVNGRSGSSLLYQTVDNGQTFTVLFDSDFDRIYGYEFARSNPNVIYVGTRLDFVRSEDNGKTWERMTFPFDQRPLAAEWTFAVDPRNAQVVYAANPHQPHDLRKSVDGGHTWTSMDHEGLGEERIHDLVVMGDDFHGLYATTTDGARVYYRDDRTGRWIDYSTGLNPSARITRMMPFYKEGVMRMATSQGIWETPLANANFTPVAQPIALNISGPTVPAGTQVQLDSYSITTQQPNTQWQWSISPEPAAISSKSVRNPLVTFTAPGAYDVTLKVTTPDKLSHSRTIHKMIIVGADDRHDDTVAGSASDNEQDLVTTGVDAVKTPTAKIMPNVIVKGERLVLRTDGLQETKRLSIYSTKGARLAQYTIPADRTSFEVSTDDMTPGVYLYEVMGVHFKSFGKILIQP